MVPSPGDKEYKKSYSWATNQRELSILDPNAAGG